MSQMPPPPPGYGSPQYGDQPPAGPGSPGQLLDRFLARLIDHVLIGVVGVLIVVVLVVGVIMGESGGMSMFGGGNLLVGAISSILLTLLYLGYFAFLESNRGQTVGKMIMKLRTVAPQGGNPTLEQAVKRNIYVAAGILGIIPLLGGCVAGIAQIVGMVMIAVGINNDTVNRQAWHDNFAGGTRVIKVG